MIGSCIDYSINKTNFAIDVSNNLTLLERKFFNHILYFIDQQGWNNQDYEIPAASFSYLIGNQENRQNHSKIKSILRRLLTKELKVINAKYVGYESCAYVAYIKIREKNIIVELSQNLKDHLNINFTNDLGIKNTANGYTKLNLNLINKLKSTHSIALYEFFLKIKNQNVNVVDVNNLIEISSCKKCYKEFKRFNQSILKPAVDEINELTDLNISFDLIKYSNEVKKIKFNIEFKKAKEKQPNKIVDSIKSIENILPKAAEIYPLLVQNLINIGITAKKAVDMHSKEDKRLQAIYDEINTKYSNKSNIEKQKLIVSMFNHNTYPNFVNAAEKVEQKQKEIISNTEIKAQTEQVLIEQKKQTEKEIIKQNNRQIFENELKKEDSQLAKIWKTITKTVELNIPIQQVKTWFNPAIANLQDNTLHIILPNRFKLDFFKRSLLRYVEKTLYNLQLNLNIKVSL